MIGWIDIAERAPEPGAVVLAATASGNTHHVRYTGAHWLPVDGRSGERIAASAITHWAEINRPETTKENP